MTKYTKKTARLSTVSGDGYNACVVVVEDIVKSDFASVILRRGRFLSDTIPEFVVFSKGLFELPGGEEIGDVSLVRPMIASVCTDTLSDQFLDCRDERR